MSEPVFFTRWRHLGKAKKQLGGCDDLDEVLEVLRERARTIALSDGVAVVRREGDEVVYVGEDAISPLWTGKRFTLRTCVSGLAMLGRQPIMIPDIRRDDRVPLNAYLSTFVQSMAVFPIGAGEPVAALGCYWAEARPIERGATELLRSLTVSASATLDRLSAQRVSPVL